MILRVGDIIVLQGRGWGEVRTGTRGKVVAIHKSLNEDIAEIQFEGIGVSYRAMANRSNPKATYRLMVIKSELVCEND